MAKVETKDKRTPVALLVGRVSSGKSSFLNAFAGGFISYSSMCRETIRPNMYTFSRSGHEKNITLLSNKLDEIHKENERMGKSIKELKEEDVTKPNIHVEYIPIRHGLDNLIIYDFGGIDDSEDCKSELFEKAIDTHLSMADIIIYVTEAHHAFDSRSEVEKFTEIKKKIKGELDSTGHYIDLIIIVNKFDDVDNKDLNNIYEKISNKSEIDTKKIFRMSSHKMLMNNVVENKLFLYVPKFYREEMSFILKNAEIIITKQIKKTLADSANINHTDIEYSDKIDLLDDSLVEKKNNNKGDWDNFTSYLKSFQGGLDGNIFEALKGKLGS